MKNQWLKEKEELKKTSINMWDDIMCERVIDGGWVTISPFVGW